ncbi:MAG: hypothetical protein M5R36_14155 [Deltaproteobacteria bacterium]|nr:hypothetical protein [Deltaproteobacteria bacterium]
MADRARRLAHPRFQHATFSFYNFIIYPAYRLAGATSAAPGAVRWMFFPLVAALLALIATIASRVSRLPPTGPLAVALFLASPTIGRALAAARPDSLTVPMTAAAALLMVMHLQQPHGERYARLSAFLIGCTFLFNQKAVLVALVLLWFYERQNAALGRSGAERFRDVAVLSLAIAAPVVLLGGLYFGIVGPPPDKNNLRLVLNVLSQVQFGEVWRALRIKIFTLLAWSTGPLVILAVWGGVRAMFHQKKFLAPQGASGSLIAVLGLVLAIQTIAMPLVVEHYFVPVYALLAIPAAWRLAGMKSPAMVGVALACVLLPQVVDRGQYRTRGGQTDRFAAYLRDLPADAPVLDTLSGFGAFRPIVSRSIYYRPAQYNNQFTEQENITRAIAKKCYAAIAQPEFLIDAPAHVQDLVKQTYERNEKIGGLTPIADDQPGFPLTPEKARDCLVRPRPAPLSTSGAVP